MTTFAAGQSGQGVSISTTGLTALFDEMSAATSANFLLIDAVVLPVAILILGARVQSYRHMGVAFACVACTLIFAFAIMTPISAPGVIDINPFAPEIMMSLGISISFDYSLFLLTRFKEERVVLFKSKLDAVLGMLRSAGHVVALSGWTLFCTFVLILAFPQNFLQSVGWSCSIVVASALLVSLTLTPALLLSFECLSFFDVVPSRRSCCCLVPREDAAFLARRALFGPPSGPAASDAPAPPASVAKVAAEIELGSPVPPPGVPDDGDDGDLGSPPPPRRSAKKLGSASRVTAPSLKALLQSVSVRGLFGLEAGPAPLLPRDSFLRAPFFSIAWAVTQPAWRYVTLLVFAGITVPFALRVAQLIPTSDNTLIYLQGSPALNAYETMKASFPIGDIDPYQVILATGVPGGALTREYFSAENRLIHTLLATQPAFVSPSSFAALSYVDGADVAFDTASAYLDPAAAAYNSSAATSYRARCSSKLNADNSTSLVTVTVTVDPDSQAMTSFINDVRALISGWRADGGALPHLALYLFGGYTTTLDVQNSLTAMLPVVIAVTALIVFTVVGSAFYSLGLVVRLLCTTGISLVWTFGMTALIYQPGSAQDAFAVLTPSVAKSSGVYWIIPLMSFTILVGLALDYDIFLMSRVVELRAKGWSDRAAVCLAVEKSGGIITAAGLIMSISFAGLLIPKAIVLNQYSFTLFFGVLLDTFVIRTLLVPAIVSALGDVRGLRANWWPGKAPPVLLGPAAEAARLLAGHWEPSDDAAEAAGSAAAASENLSVQRDSEPEGSSGSSAEVAGSEGAPPEAAAAAADI